MKQLKPMNRMKRILSLIAAAAMTLTLAPVSTLAAPTQTEPLQELTQYVNPLIGTHNFKGNSEFAGLAPFVTAPFAMTNFTPQTRENSIDSISYQYQNTEISGFFATHQPAIWMGDYGYMNIMPQIGDIKPSLNDRKLSFSHDDEVSTPYYYKVDMGKKEGKPITGEMTATERCAIYRFTFPENEKSSILVESARGRGNGTATIDTEKNEIYGWNNDNMSSHLNNNPPKNLKGYYVVQFSKPISVKGTYKNYSVSENVLTVEGQKSGAYVTFATAANETVEMKIGTSFISVEQARKNIDQEIGEKSFETVKQDLEEIWNQKLNTIQIEGATNDENHIFYTAMFHASMYPRMFYENVDGKDQYYSPYDDQIHDGRSYTDFSLWDTFRAQNSFLTLTEPDRVGDMVTSLLQNFQEGGYMPKWPNPGYSNIMIGTHADSVVAEAIGKGLLDESKYDLAYQAVFKDAMVPQKGDGTIKWGDRQNNVPYEARGGLGSYKALGYVANGYANENVSRTIEFAYDDWCVAQVAKAVGKDGDADFFMNRSMNYKNAINPETGYAMGRDIDGNFTTSGEQFTEGDRRKYTWFAPHDPQGLIDLMTGYKDENFYNKELEGAWTQGWLEQQNEPCHNYSYMFNFSGRPDLTQKYARETLVKSYSNDNAGMLGNDDCGQMSAWYIFSAMGFYPVNPASGEYMIGSPIFDKVTINNPKTKTKFVITAENNQDDANFYIQSSNLNGAEHNIPVVTYDEIVKGGSMGFVMGNTASDWAKDYKKTAIVPVEGATIVDPVPEPPFFGDSSVKRVIDVENLAKTSTISVKDNKFLTGGDLGDPNISLKDGKLNYGFKSTKVTADDLKDDANPYYITMKWDTPQDFDTLSIYSNYPKSQGPKNIDVEVFDGENWTVVKSNYQIPWTTDGETAEEQKIAFEKQNGKTGLRFRVKEAGLSWGGFAIRELEAYTAFEESIQKDAPVDVNVEIKFNGNKLTNVTLGGQALTPDKDYTVNKNLITIDKSVFATAYLGQDIPLTFTFNQGSPSTIKLNIIATPQETLESTIAQASAMDLSNVTEGFKVRFAEELQLAQDVLENASATEDEINAAIIKLRGVMDEVADYLISELDYAANFEAEYFDEFLGSIQVENNASLSGKGNIGYISHENWIKFRFVDFGSQGLESVSAKYSQNNMDKRGTIEVYIDSMEPDQLIASIPLTGTQSWNDYRDSATIPAAADVTGVHDIYVKFINESDPTNFCNVDYLLFKEKEPNAFEITMPAIDNLEGKSGTSFTIPVSISSFPTDQDYKAIEGIVTIPEGVTVASVVPAVTMSDVTFDYNLSDGKLRFAFLATDKTPLSLASGKLLDLNLSLTEEKAPAETFAVVFNQFRAKSSDTAFDFDLTGAVSNITIAKESVTAEAKELFVSDGGDVIPVGKKAVSVIFTDVDATSDIRFGGTQFYYSPDRSAVNTQVVYVAMVDESISLTDLNNPENYTITESGVQTLIFGDTNDKDGVNAQDALNTVSAWLRKGDAPTEKMMLAMNVNADGRIDTADSIAIVDWYVGAGAKIFPIVSK